MRGGTPAARVSRRVPQARERKNGGAGIHSQVTSKTMWHLCDRTNLLRIIPNGRNEQTDRDLRLGS